MNNKDGLGRSIEIFGCYGYIIVYGYSNNTSIAINIKDKTILYFEEDNSVFPVANEPAKNVDPTKWKKICGRENRRTAVTGGAVRGEE